jgi:hypothetical protein
MLRAITIATAAFVYAAGNAATAGSAVRFETEVEPSSFAFPGLTTLTYRLKMTTDLSAERFSVRVVPSVFAEGGTPIAINHLSDVSFTGPGQVGMVRTEEALLVCARNRAYGPKSLTFDVSLPPLSTTVLSARFESGRVAPFADTDYRVRFTASPTMVSGEAGTLDREETFFTPAPRRTGKTGVRIQLRSTPAAFDSRDLSTQNRGKLRRGQRVVFRGTTYPVLRNHRIVLQYRQFGARTRAQRMRNLPAVKTDNRGRFRATWRPRVAGGYHFWALSAPTPQLVADRTGCPLIYRVR